MSERTPDEQAYVEALLREREGYARYDRADRVEGVDAELKRLGVTRDEVHAEVETAVSEPAEKAVPARRARPRRA